MIAPPILIESKLQVFNTELVWEFGESKYRELLREKASLCIRFRPAPK